MIPEEVKKRIENNAVALIGPDEPMGYLLRNAYVSGGIAEYDLAQKVINEYARCNQASQPLNNGLMQSTKRQKY